MSAYCMTNDQLATKVLDLADEFDLNQECTCEESDGTCWYHLTDEERWEYKVRYIADLLIIDGPTDRETDR